MTEFLDIPRFLRTKYKDEYMNKEQADSSIIRDNLELTVQVENIKSVAQQFIDSPDSIAARTVMINALKQPNTSQLKNLKADNAEEVLSLIRNHKYKTSMLNDGCDAVVEIDCLIEEYIKQLRKENAKPT